MEQPTTIETRRLAFLRYLYQLGERQSREPEPIGATALLVFHDAVELFLQLASERVDAGKGQPSFLEYWDLISNKLPDEVTLSQKETMRRLNKSRVALKHHGTLPSRLDLEAFRASATAFFQENTPLVFGIEFSDVSMLEFVQPNEAKDRLHSAQRQQARGNLSEAAKDASVAFSVMLDDYEDRKRDGFRRSPFLFAQNMRFLSGFHIGISRSGRSRQENKLAEFIDKTSQSIEAMGNALKVMALGIDYRRYSRFQMLAGSTTRMLGGKYHHVSSGDADSLTAEDIRFCIDFVVEAAITLQEFDYTTPASTAQLDRSSGDTRRT